MQESDASDLFLGRHVGHMLGFYHLRGGLVNGLFRIDGSENELFDAGAGLGTRCRHFL